MTRWPTRSIATFVGVHLLISATAAAAENWRPTRWHDEQAYELTTQNWRAIVSAERARLVHFGPANPSETNFVFAPARKDDPVGWGGHRVWLGPQNTWSLFWPPPVAWERSAAEKITTDGARLELQLPDAGEGWPRMTRVYELANDGRLACRIVLAPGGTREVQIMQILQTVPTSEVLVPIIATDFAPLGCVLLPPFAGRRELTPLGETMPRFLTRTGAALRVEHSSELDKIAFPPQDLVARFESHVLHVARGDSHGNEAGAPDRGYYTQICPGAANMPLIELEQMSPLYAAGEAAQFTMLVSVTQTTDDPAAK